MWGVDRLEAFVRCDKVEVCANCGKTRSPVTCLCGKEFGDHCVSRCAWIDRVADATL
jgi:hypothetical protein